MIPTLGRLRACGVPVRLPDTLVDFDKRGFHAESHCNRELLERHAKAFIDGFNRATSHWREPHCALQEVACEDRGFAYEGAGMHAGLLDTFSRGRTDAFARLLAGEGDRYVHLSHVGYGWGLGPARLGLPAPVPATPLLRWLALDGAGFASTFFGGLRSVHLQAWRTPTATWRARLSGSGRALWFVHGADLDRIAASIHTLPEVVRADLWSGIGLAAAYAGSTDTTMPGQLRAAAGRYHRQLGQGVLFAVTARHRSGVVPSLAAQVCREVTGLEVSEASTLTDVAAIDLTDPGHLRHYLLWKARLEELITRPRRQEVEAG